MKRFRLAAPALLALWAAASPVAARAADDDPPAAIRALAAGDSAALESAPDRDDLISTWIRDAGRRSKLEAPVLAGLVRAAAKHDLKSLCGPLRSVLRDRQASPEARRAATEALGTLGSVADVGALGDAVAEFPEEASRALAAIGGTSALSALVRGGGATPPSAVLAARAKLGEAEALDALFRLALDGTPNTDGALRDEALGRLAFATGRDFGADRQAWRGYWRRLAWSNGFADPDNDRAQALVRDAAKAIAAGGDAGVGADLEALLLDAGAPVPARAKAALAIGLSGSRAHNAALLRSCQNLEPGDVRRYAADALSRVGDLSCAADLAKMLVHDEDRDRLGAKRSLRTEFTAVDPAFVRCLYRLGLRGATEPLLGVMEGEYRTGLHRDCVRALGEVSGGREFGYQPDAKAEERVAAAQRIRAWWRIARNDVALAPNPSDPGWGALQQEITVLIRTLGEKRFLTQSRAKKALIVLAEAGEAQLVAALGHETLHIRMGTAEVMEGTGLRAFAPALAARLATETSVPARTKLLTALESCGRPGGDHLPAGGEATRESVRRAMTDRVSEVRIAAVRVLGLLGDRERDIPLIVASRSAPDPTGEYAPASAGALLRLGDRSGLADLAKELRSDDVARRADSFRLLGECEIAVAGYDPDGSPESRERAVAAGLDPLVPPGGHK